MRLLQQMDMRGQRVLVTGAAAGIGFGTCEALGEMGATLLMADLDAGNLERAVATLRERGVNASGFPSDVSRPEGVDALVAQAVTEGGALKGLVNVVGDTFRARAEDHPVERWNEVLQLSLTSHFLMARACLPALRRGTRPSIVNVASSFGLIGSPRRPAYCAAKGGVISLTRQLAVDYGPEGIRVNAVCPGPTLSPRMERHIAAGQTDRARNERQVLLGRYAAPAEIGNVIAFLLTDAASFMHGAAVAVDGGQTVHTGTLEDS